MNNCPYCPFQVDNDLDFNSHLLFEHGKCRPTCSSKVDEKKMQIAELMKGDFDHARNCGKLLNCYYIIVKTHEMGLANLRKIYKQGKRVGTDKRGRPTYSRAEVTLGEMKKDLDFNLYKHTYEAKVYDDRYDINQSKKPNGWYAINDEERNIEEILKNGN